MIEREGFEAFCKSTNPKYKTTDDSVIDRAAWKIWREACAWQRKQDAALVEENSHMFFTAKACDSLAGAIREQAFLAALRVPNEKSEGPRGSSRGPSSTDGLAGEPGNGERR